MLVLKAHPRLWLVFCGSFIRTVALFSLAKDTLFAALLIEDESVLLSASGQWRWGQWWQWRRRKAVHKERIFWSKPIASCRGQWTWNDWGGKGIPVGLYSLIIQHFLNVDYCIYFCKGFIGNDFFTLCLDDYHKNTSDRDPSWGH